VRSASPASPGSGAEDVGGPGRLASSIPDRVALSCRSDRGKSPKLNALALITNDLLASFRKVDGFANRLSRI
jgi:hypothetical protein